MITAQEYKKLLDETRTIKKQSFDVIMAYILQDLEKDFEEVYYDGVNEMETTIRVKVDLTAYNEGLQKELYNASIFDHWHNETYLKDEVRHIIINHFESYGYKCRTQQTDGKSIYVELGVE